MNRLWLTLALMAAAATAGYLIAGKVSAPSEARAEGKGGFKKELHNPPKLYRSAYYTQMVGVRGGKTVYVSGQWSCSAKGELLHKGDLAAQIKQSFENLKAALEAVGLKPSDVVKINVYLVGNKQKDLAALDEGLTACFGKGRDFASTVVGVAGLARDGMLAEVEAIAVVE